MKKKNNEYLLSLRTFTCISHFCYFLLFWACSALKAQNRSDLKKKKLELLYSKKLTCENKRLLNVNEITRFWQQKTLKKPFFLYRTNYLVVGKNVYIFKNEISRCRQKNTYKEKNMRQKMNRFFFTAAAAKGLKLSLSVPVKYFLFLVPCIKTFDNSNIGLVQTKLLCDSLIYRILLYYMI